ncbi:hypothetical protein AB0I51_48330 [Streptomyces sp. NPDC050549]|uniref:hypothetical protein n=1 Tax=Streptomyces sp. NPDC050549 TaxID=3155406 RepID=UPI00344777B8
MGLRQGGRWLGFLGPGMVGKGHMGSWWLAAGGTRVRSVGQAWQRAAAFADRLGLRVGEVMRFSRNFSAELRAGSGRPATEVLVDRAGGAVPIGYGPAMRWNTDDGMPYGTRSGTRVPAGRAKNIALAWLRARDRMPTAGDPESYPGHYALHTLHAGEITGMLSVDAATGQVWDGTWHGTYIATGRR